MTEITADLREQLAEAMYLDAPYEEAENDPDGRQIAKVSYDWEGFKEALPECASLIFANVDAILPIISTHFASALASEREAGRAEGREEAARWHDAKAAESNRGADNYDHQTDYGRRDENPWRDRAKWHRDEAARLRALGPTDLVTREEMEAAVAAERRKTTDAQYMLDTYHALLGPKARELADKWRAKGVRRFHASWGPDAGELSGEDRADVLLTAERSVKEPMDPDGDEPPQSGRPQVHYSEALRARPGALGGAD